MKSILYFIGLFFTALLHCYNEPIYEFNAEGHLIYAASADGSCRYAYAYNKFGQATEAINLNSNEKVQRIYDFEGNLLEERFPTDISIKNTYDSEGKRVALTLPDGSWIKYCYKDGVLRKVKRKSKEGNTLYAHHYIEHDRYGNPLLQQLIGNIGKISTSYDKQGRCIQQFSPAGLEEVLEFDSQGNVLRIRQPSGESRYEYDADDQLVSEETPFFNYLHTLDKSSLPELQVTYDGFERVISIQKENEFHLTYSYDGFHRVLEETTYIWRNTQWKKKEKRLFLHDNQNEIGAYNAQGILCELRILGNTPKADIGAAIALEIEGKVFAPIHDLMGNIASLISLTSQNIEETYHYHAFGEEIPLKNPISPWRYRSKRLNSLSGLVFFGRRFYNPQTQQWLTPDPHFPADGTNPYTYCRNNPLIYDDLYGLESSFSNLGTYLGTHIQQYCYNYVPFIGARNVGIWIGEALGAPPISKEFYHSKVGSVGNLHPGKNHVNVWINGMNTNLEDTILYANIISKACGDEKVIYAYNSTRGQIGDIWEHIAGKVNHGIYLKTNALYMCIEAIHLAITEVGGTGNGGKVTVFAHSQGGDILARALRYLTPEEQQMLTVYTFGTAALFSKNNLAYIQHILSSEDIIPGWADPLRFWASRWVWEPLLSLVWTPSIVRIIPSPGGSYRENHSFLSPVYQQEILRVGQEIQNSNLMPTPP